MRRTPRLLAPAAIGALLLAGCTPDAAPSPVPSVSAAPVFASEEEALAAAEAAYGAYLDAMAAVMADRGSDPDRLQPFLTPAIYERERASYEAFRDNNWTGVGSISFTMELQSADLISGRVTTYVCDDRSSLNVVDIAGESIIPADRPKYAASVVEMTWSDGLRIESQDGWDGNDICPS